MIVKQSFEVLSVGNGSEDDAKRLAGELNKLGEQGYGIAGLAADGTLVILSKPAGLEAADASELLEQQRAAQAQAAASQSGIAIPAGMTIPRNS